MTRSLLPFVVGVVARIVGARTSQPPHRSGAPPRKEQAAASSTESSAPVREEASERTRVESSPIEPPGDRPIATPQVEVGAPQRKLRFELIPRSMHFKSARAVLSIDAWCLLRYMCLKFDGEKCGECGWTDKDDLECHEVWEYSSRCRPGGETPVHVMKLTGLRALCRLCHLGKHIGFAKKTPDEYSDVKKQLLRVYGLSVSELAQIEHSAFEDVNELEKCGMRELDLTYLNDGRCSLGPLSVRADGAVQCE